MRHPESLSSYRRAGETLAQTQERLRTVVADAEDRYLRKWLHTTSDGRAVLRLATSLFGSRAAAMQWLSRPMIELGGINAQDLAKTAWGRKRVLEVLDRLNHGVFS